MHRLDPQKARMALESLTAIRVWPKGFHGYVKRARCFLKVIVKNAFFENFMTLCVTINTVTLAIDHYGISENTGDILSTFNMVFTVIFAIEMALKLLALGFVKYLRDKMNYLDGSVVLLSLVEVAFLSGGGALSAFRTVRIFRTFRVLRVARLLRTMRSMMSIIQVISRSISSFIYLAMLLLLFLFIYALLGMQIFGGQFDFPDGKPRNNFDTFNSAFVTSFIVLSMENWQSVMYDAMRTDVWRPLTALYFISWIFIGNFMLLNLFLAILLDSFSEVEEEEHMNPEQIAQREKKLQEEMLRKEGNDLISSMSGLSQSSGKSKSKKSAFKKKKKKKKKKDPNGGHIEENSIEIDMEMIIKRRERLK